VNPVIPTIYWIATSLAFLAAVYFGYVAATESEGQRKSKSRLIASLIFSSWFFLSAAAWFLYDRTRPIFEISGTLESLRVLSSDSRHYSAYMRIATSTGGEIMIHISDRSTEFQPGQRLDVRYRGDTGELIDASFYSNVGQKQGVFHSSSTFSQLVGMAIGLFCIWASIRKYRRDPEGQET
jgi:hypothetical protein